MEEPACFILPRDRGSYNDLLLSLRLLANGLHSCCFENGSTYTWIVCLSAPSGNSLTLLGTTFSFILNMPF